MASSIQCKASYNGFRARMWHSLHTFGTPSRRKKDGMRRGQGRDRKRERKEREKDEKRDIRELVLLV